MKAIVQEVAKRSKQIDNRIAYCASASYLSGSEQVRWFRVASSQAEYIYESCSFCHRYVQTHTDGNCPSLKRERVDDCETQDHLGKNGTHTYGNFPGWKGQRVDGKKTQSCKGKVNAARVQCLLHRA